MRGIWPPLKSWKVVIDDSFNTAWLIIVQHCYSQLNKTGITGIATGILCSTQTLSATQGSRLDFPAHTFRYRLARCQPGEEGCDTELEISSIKFNGTIYFLFRAEFLSRSGLVCYPLILRSSHDLLCFQRFWSKTKKCLKIDDQKSLIQKILETTGQLSFICFCN